MSLCVDPEWPSYGESMTVIHNAAGNEVGRELRGRDQELLEIVIFVELDDGRRVETRPGEIKLGTRLPWDANGVRREVRRMVYDDSDRWPRWRDLMAGLEERGVRADDAALVALPYVLELDPALVARYEPN